jgi:D-sedoheptulose 7-phosphate isomerase
MERKSHIENTLERFPQLSVCREDIEAALGVLAQGFLGGGKLLVMGNGGSSADAEHLCAELTKGVYLERLLHDDERTLFDGAHPLLSSMLQSGLPAMSLGVAHSFVTAFINDVHPEYIFGQQVWIHGNKPDVVFGISTSGNSNNVIFGLQTAKAKGLKTILLTGKKESACSEVADISIMVPETEVHKIQELHLPVYHALCFELEHIFFNREDGLHYQKFKT